ncbi:MAG: hypothetical protein JNM72_13335 [Deltaproteobacteria bacterium]|nr:hypothetical protein [Deltaproteobacteria bacterium]
MTGAPRSLLLLQPPGPGLPDRPLVADRERPGGRWASAAGPAWPSTLLVESAGARGAGLLSVLDAQATHPDAADALGVAHALRPAAVLALVGGRACAEDPGFLVRLREVLPEAVIVVSGPAVEAAPAAALQRFEVADGALLQVGLPGAPWQAGRGAPGVAWRGAPAAALPRPAAALLGVPQLELFPWRRYADDGFGGLVGQPLAQLPWVGGAPVPREPAALRAEAEAWRAAGAVGLRLRGGPLSVEDDAVDAMLDALRGVGLPHDWELGPALLDPARAARLAAAGARQLHLAVRLGATEEVVELAGQPVLVEALRAVVQAAGLPCTLLVDDLDELPAVARARALTVALGARLDLRPGGAQAPAPALVEATSPRRRDRAAAAVRAALRVGARLARPALA